jgi:beta-lactam-binding protein with PASTA domain
MPATPRDTCAVLEAASLSCQLAPSPTPATSPQEFGIVTTENPAAGSQVDKGTTVTITYPETFTMPTAIGQSGTDACTALRQYVLELPNNVTKSPGCTVTPGSPARPNSNANKVYQQNPVPGGPQPADAGVTLTVYTGTAKLADYTGQDGQAALADCNKTFNCALAAGDPPVGHPQDIGKVQRQDHPAGDYQTDTAVQLVVWNSNNTVPDVTGQPIAQACQTISNAGFVCDPNSAHPFTNSFQIANPAGNPQNPAGGSSAALGSTVIVPNTPWQPIPLVVYQATSGDNVYVVRLAGQPVPAGYGANPVTLGNAYGVGSGIPVGAWTPDEDFCTASVNACNGHDPNHMFTRTPIGTVQQYDGPRWVQGGHVADLIAPQGGGCGAGQLMVYRVWNFTNNGATHTYAVTTNPAGFQDNEPVGCVWAP